MTMKSRLRGGLPRGGYSAMPHRGADAYGVGDPRASLVKLPPADTLPLPRESFGLIGDDPIAAAVLRAISLLVDESRYLSFTNIPFTVGTTSQVVLERATNKRAYLFIINTHAANRLFVNFQNSATLQNGVPLAPNLGFWEWLFTVPQDTIEIVANGATTTGVLTFAEFKPRESA